MVRMHCPQCGATITGKSKWQVQGRLVNHYKRKHPRLYKKYGDRMEKIGSWIGTGLSLLSGL